MRRRKNDKRTPPEILNDFSEGTIPRRRLNDLQRRARGREIGDHVLSGQSRFVTGVVGVISRVEIAFAGRFDDGLARRVVRLVKGDRAGYYLDEDRTRMTMPAADAPRWKVDGLHGNVERGFDHII